MGGGEIGRDLIKHDTLQNYRKVAEGIGRKSEGAKGLRILGMGMICKDFQDEGKVEESRNKLK